jgi:signal peptidase I
MRRPKPWLAALLSLFGGPLGQIYDGRFRRSIVLWFIGICLTCLFFLMVVSFELNRLALCVLAVAIVAYPIFLAVDAFAIARRVDGTTRQWYQRWWVYIGMFFFFYSSNFLAAIFTRNYIAESFAVPGRAMGPTILHMDRILVDKLWSSSETLHRDDIVVFRSAGKGSPLYVMRVVGLPGDTIEIRDRVVYINNEEFNDIHAFHDSEPPPDKTFINFGPINVPQRTFFVMGDNRFRSNDSRRLGAIPFADYYGHAKMIFWSRDYEFQNQNDSSTGIPKAIRWDRIGTKIR